MSVAILKGRGPSPPLSLSFSEHDEDDSDDYPGLVHIPSIESLDESTSQSLNQDLIQSTPPLSENLEDYFTNINQIDHSSASGNFEFLPAQHQNLKQSFSDVAIKNLKSEYIILERKLNSERDLLALKQRGNLKQSINNPEISQYMFGGSDDFSHDRSQGFICEEALQSGVSMNDVAPMLETKSFPVAAESFGSSSNDIHRPNPTNPPTLPPYQLQPEHQNQPDYSVLSDRIAQNKLYLDHTRGFYGGGMQIRVLGVPQQNAKSRVETQIKICIQLVTEKGGNEDKVQMWSHLRLPEHLVVKDKPRSRKDLDGISNSGGILEMEAVVVCASDPSKTVHTCSGCIQRERKRLKKKEMNKKGDDADAGVMNDSLDDDAYLLEQSKIILFNCTKIVDFSSGDTILPSRITCYCRHHNEKTGFCIYFILRDQSKKIIATGISPPIMITDDHKSSKSTKPRKRTRNDEIEDPVNRPNSPAPDKRLHSTQSDISPRTFLNNRQQSFTQLTNGMVFPDTTNFMNGSMFPSVKSESNPYFSPRDMYGSPGQFSHNFEPISPLMIPAQGSSLNRVVSTTALPSSMASIVPSSFDLDVTSNGSPDIIGQYGMRRDDNMGLNSQKRSTSLVNLMQLQQQQQHQQQQQQQQIAEMNQLFNNNQFFASIVAPQLNNLSVTNPVVLRVIPSEGPMHGGLEITVLGSGFRDGLTVKFGDNPATITQIWSSTTLVCILPPSPFSGAVPVSIKDYESQSSGVVFTYKDDAERTLMELALQVVGLRMTGKLEDARNIAMRIFNSSPNTSDNSNSNTASDQSPMNLAHLHLMLSRAGNNRALLNSANLEETIINSLSTSGNFVSTPVSATGHTILHLSIMAKFNRLAIWLAKNDSNLDVQDVNGYSALHFAALLGNLLVVKELVAKGADTNLETDLGWTPDELAYQQGYDEVADHIQEWKAEDISDFHSETEADAENDEDHDEGLEMGSVSRVRKSFDAQRAPQTSEQSIETLPQRTRTWSRALFGNWAEPRTPIARVFAGPHSPPDEPVDAEPVSTSWIKASNNFFSKTPDQPNDFPLHTNTPPPGGKNANQEPNEPAQTGWNPFSQQFPGMPNFSFPSVPNMPNIPQITLPIPHINIPNLGISATMQEMQMNFPAVNLQFNPLQFFNGTPSDPAVAAAVYQQQVWYLRWMAAMQGMTGQQGQVPPDVAGLLKKNGQPQPQQIQERGVSLKDIASSSSSSSAPVTANSSTVHSHCTCHHHMMEASSSSAPVQQHTCQHVIVSQRVEDDRSMTRIWISILIAIIAILAVRIFINDSDLRGNQLSEKFSSGISWAYDAARDGGFWRERGDDGPVAVN
ncbi:SPT3 Dosage dependent suppressor of Ty-induced promoter mutations-like protein [Nowakowskiella sp. JEL0407]|nr:SPT3 Dosage dependent suppressor of Ty-induced promoter mutations-like protein [Nowakowskiella sp. JEL0407]